MVQNFRIYFFFLILMLDLTETLIAFSKLGSEYG